MSNTQFSPVQPMQSASGIRKFAPIFFGIAFVLTLYAAFMIKHSAEHIFNMDEVPEWAQRFGLNITVENVPIIGIARTFTIITALVYACAAVVLYFKRNVSLTTVLTVVALISAVVPLSIMASGYIEAVQMPGGHNVHHLTQLFAVVMTVVGFVSALLGAIDARRTKRAICALDQAGQQQYAKALSTAKKMRVSNIVLVVILLIEVVLAAFMMYAAWDSVSR